VSTSKSASFCWSLPLQQTVHTGGVVPNPCVTARTFNKSRLLKISMVTFYNVVLIYLFWHNCCFISNNENYCHTNLMMEVAGSPETMVYFYQTKNTTLKITAIFIITATCTSPLTIFLISYPAYIILFPFMCFNVHFSFPVLILYSNSVDILLWILNQFFHPSNVMFQIPSVLCCRSDITQTYYIWSSIYSTVHFSLMALTLYSNTSKDMSQQRLECGSRYHKL